MNPIKKTYNFLEDCFEEVTAGFLTFFIFSWILYRLIFGIMNANSSSHCIVRSIGDIIIAPMYTLGCNIGKDRFEIRVN